jgi:hypothetical protein
MRAALTLTFLVLATPVWSAAKPDWKAYAACAAAYRVNAAIADPDRSTSMKAQISDTANDYEAAAVSRRKLQIKSDSEAAKTAVADYERRRMATFRGQKREQVEKFIDACPQTED